MTIVNSDDRDIDEIFRLYEIATNYQISKSVVPWPTFDRALIESEIEDYRQWKIDIDDKIACVWAVSYSDPQIWKDSDNDKAIYIHRIATNPDFKGQNFVEDIVNWARMHADFNDKDFIRMDTVGENLGLINHYKKNGFNFMGLSKLNDTAGLPAHYENATVSLFEIAL